MCGGNTAVPVVPVTKYPYVWGVVPPDNWSFIASTRNTPMCGGSTILGHKALGDHGKYPYVWG